MADASNGGSPKLRRTWGQRLVIATNLVLIAVSLGVAALLDYGYGRAAAINRVALDRSLTAVPGDLEPGERVLNILLVGSDSSATLDEDDPIQVGRQGERFGDVIIIAHLDERSGDIALLSLPRDLWVTVAGNDRQSKINRAFEIGGPAVLIETIEDEFDIPIHHYVNVDFAGFQGLVSAVGSVEVYFETPARDWNVNAQPEPRSQTGFLMAEPGCQSLDPERALAYVRSRYYQTQNDAGEWVTDPTADLGRIRRQQDFLRRLIQRAIAMGARNPFVLSDLIDTGLENVAIDQRLTPQILVDVGGTYRSFDPDQLQTYSFPAADSRVGERQVLQPLDREAAPLIKLFQGAPFGDPSTIGVRVVSLPDDELGRKSSEGVGSRSRSTTSQVFDPSAILRQAGFDPEEVERSDLPDGVTVQHGPDGRHAAEAVAETIRAGAGGGGVEIEQVGGLSGRSIEVVIGNQTVEEPQEAPAETPVPDRNDQTTAAPDETVPLATAEPAPEVAARPSVPADGAAQCSN